MTKDQSSPVTTLSSVLGGNCNVESNKTSKNRNVFDRKSGRASKTEGSAIAQVLYLWITPVTSMCYGARFPCNYQTRVILSAHRVAWTCSVRSDAACESPL